MGSYVKGAYSSAIPDGVHCTQRCTLNSQMCVSFDSLLVYLIGQQAANTFRERIHGDACGPQNKVCRDRVLFNFPFFVLLRIDYMFGVD